MNLHAAAAAAAAARLYVLTDPIRIARKHHCSLKRDASLEARVPASVFELVTTGKLPAVANAPS